MDLSDLSPSCAPSFNEQADALSKGLGRAVLWALAGSLDTEALFRACLHDERFDQQIDELRANWMWKLLKTTNAIEQFRNPLLEALYKLECEADAHQLVALGGLYAAGGDHVFLGRLYEIVETQPFGNIPWLGEEELLYADREKAFLFIASLHGQRLISSEWDWNDSQIVDKANEVLGAERVDHLLDSTTESAIAHFRSMWRKSLATTRTPFDPAFYREKLGAMTVDQLFSEIETNSSWRQFRGWGMKAKEADLLKVIDRMIELKSDKDLAKVLQVFSNRALPHFDPQFIEYCQHSDDEVRRRAFNALQMNTHSAIREFALRGLKEAPDRYAVGLFIRNFESGDEQLLRDAIQLPADPCELHWLLMDIIKILERNSDSDPSCLGLISYRMTPCEACRSDVAKILKSRDAAPNWLKLEAMHDSAEECRNLFKDA